MVALIVGVILIAFCVFAVIPASLCGFGLDWSREVIDFLKGFAPVFAAERKKRLLRKVLKSNSLLFLPGISLFRKNKFECHWVLALTKLLHYAMVLYPVYVEGNMLIARQRSKHDAKPRT